MICLTVCLWEGGRMKNLEPLEKSSIMRSPLKREKSRSFLNRTRFLFLMSFRYQRFILLVSLWPL